ncbi:hypothetical protein Gotri_020000 [Gossypium trilobum]|uniref:Uncharacterized protein n=1 Tax=Gossypium trilobum TaxID=34281 RepID=A0A7J9D7Z1_9ROSI|nr:hypothetical protein [Gossypium trilobum]
MWMYGHAPKQREHLAFGGVRTPDLWHIGEAKCCLSITTGAKEIVDLMGVCWDETKKLSSCDHIVDVDAATATEINEDGNNSEKLRPRSENSEDPQDSIGPFGQIKLAAEKCMLLCYNLESFGSFYADSLLLLLVDLLLY